MKQNKLIIIFRNFFKVYITISYISLRARGLARTGHRPPKPAFVGSNPTGPVSNVNCLNIRRSHSADRLSEILYLKINYLFFENYLTKVDIIKGEKPDKKILEDATGQEGYHEVWCERIKVLNRENDDFEKAHKILGLRDGAVDTCSIKDDEIIYVEIDECHPDEKQIKVYD